MPLKSWSDTITIAELSDEPLFSDDMDQLVNRIDEIRHDGDSDVPNIIIDLAQVNSVNSSNLGSLLRVRKLLEMTDRRLLICGVTDTIWSAMIATGLDRIFAFATDVTTALAEIQLGIGPGSGVDADED
ncbi:MAG: STAS domain-containing protein [Planctomycetes bacterium]|jgi:anti-anti-sigma factor|nr:STAS domain-containing protein [Planctomycetota bacterium]MCP4838974.1 STAS domain-containing protein [Planctomycetota bacterium]